MNEPTKRVERNAGSNHVHYFEGVAAMAKPSLTTLDRFMQKIERIPFSGCWIWVASCQRRGYGQFRWKDSSMISAHRASWELFNGPIQDGLWVLHRCDVPACVNPNHLFLGTNSDNQKDSHRKGRRPWRVPNSGFKKGLLNPNGRLSPDQKERVLTEKNISGSEFARMFGVSKTTTCRIRKCAV